MAKKTIIVISGAGISAESGVKTFRDSDGLWEGYDVMEVATPEGWQKNKALVLDFYNQRRKQLLNVLPNKAHELLATLEKNYTVKIITQNVDDLHERAGSKQVLHLHGELFKVRSTQNPNYILDWKTDLSTNDKDENGHQLRPHIVWFGEAVPAIEEAVEWVYEADILLVIGTSLQVYPAAGLLNYAPKNTPIFYIDPKPAEVTSFPKNIKIIPEVATQGMEIFVNELKGLEL